MQQPQTKSLEEDFFFLSFSHACKLLRFRSDLSLIWLPLNKVEKKMKITTQFILQMTKCMITWLQWVHDLNATKAFDRSGNIIVDPLALHWQANTKNYICSHSLNPPFFKGEIFEVGGIDVTKNPKKGGIEKLLNGGGTL